ncbi:hypothetical protein CEP54_011120 [Fusarium duplospermum]|uniref:Uncharacterized protein n=1 Tax=Fusarium duplospermum TaxID=1325734 RepID=A0A428PG22_9HYPO|nr:hypothetical protein CEP54_011120 [Fusarium duplospermum]
MEVDMMSLDAPYSIHILSLGEACPPASEPDARGDKAQRRHGARKVRHLRVWGLFAVGLLLLLLLLCFW